MRENAYRLGFAFINLKKLPEARTAFSDAASVSSPYKGAAQDKLKTLRLAPTAPQNKLRPSYAIDGIC